MPRRYKTLRSALRDEVIAAATEEMRRVGPSAFKVSTLVERFADRGIGKSTMYGWIAVAVESGAIGRAVAAAVEQSAAHRAATHADPALDAALSAAKHLPVLVGLDEIAGAGPIKVIELLNESIGSARLVMKHATGDDGKPRATKTLLHASEHLRRCLETACRIMEKINDIQRVESFHNRLIEEVKKESPLCAEHILMRLDHLAQDWGG